METTLRDTARTDVRPGDAERTRFELPETLNESLRIALYGLEVTMTRQRSVDFDARRDGEIMVSLVDRAPSVCRSQQRLRSEKWFSCDLLADGTLHACWPGIAQAWISANGEATAVCPDADPSPQDLRDLVFGRVLSFALVAKGIEPLHAAAVVINDRAVAFLGDCGFGKSTLAAEFLSRGHRVMTDDVVVADGTKGPLCVHPGSPWLKLFPRVAERCLPSRIAESFTSPHSGKMFVPLRSHERSESPVRLGAVYVLRPDCYDGGMSTGLRRLSQVESTFALIRHTFNTTVTTRARLGRQFEKAASLASSSELRELLYTPGESSAAEICTHVLNQIQD